MSVEDFHNEDIVYRMGRIPNQIDILMSISGVTFDDAWEHRESGTVEGVDIFVIGRADQLRNKRASDRPKDRIDADWLEHMQKKPDPPGE
jgi:hypothetical protein